MVQDMQFMLNLKLHIFKMEMYFNVHVFVRYSVIKSLTLWNCVIVFYVQIHVLTPDSQRLHEPASAALFV